MLTYFRSVSPASPASAEQIDEILSRLEERVTLLRRELTRSPDLELTLREWLLTCQAHKLLGELNRLTRLTGRM